MTLFNNTNNFMCFLWFSLSDVRSNWFDWSNLFKIRVMISSSERLALRFFTHSSSFSFVSSKIHFLVTISVSIRNFLRFSMFFFVSKRVLSVVVCDFIWLIMIHRSCVKWRQCSNKCFEIWVKLQFSLHFFVS